MRLEQSIEGLHTPTSSSTELFVQDANDSYTWSLFDEASLQSAAYQFWPVDTELGQGLTIQ